MSYTDPIWEHVIENRDQIATLHYEYKDLSRRVGDMERKFRKIRPNLCTELMVFLKQVMTPRQWAIVVFLTLASAAGIISPKQIVDHYLMLQSEEVKLR